MVVVVDKDTFRGLFRDLSAISLIVANVFTLVLVLVQGWNLGALLWVYLFQSVIIGISWFGKFLIFRKQKRGIKKFTFLHYVFPFFMMHGIYMAFISLFFGWDNTLYILTGAGIFLVNHGFSFFYNLSRDKKKFVKGDFIALTSAPYARIIPMHVSILFFVFIGRLFPVVVTTVVFLLLKSWLDVVMHVGSHKEKKR
jgi:hypothetical protein